MTATIAIATGIGTDTAARGTMIAAEIDTTTAEIETAAAKLGRRARGTLEVGAGLARVRPAGPPLSWPYLAGGCVINLRTFVSH